MVAPASTPLRPGLTWGPHTGTFARSRREWVAISALAGAGARPRGPVARHNREGRGTDQRGFEYRISYQPDWLKHVKVSRALPTGRQSTMTLFRNPCDSRERPPGRRVRTRITCPEQKVDVEVVVRDGSHGVCRVMVACSVPSPDDSSEEEIVFTLEDGLPARV